MFAARARAVWSWPTFASLLLVQLWIAHLCVFFAHEYSHSFVAWLLGWKTNPLALHYPPLSPIVVLLQFGINQNVNEVPIFASGHGVAAAVIAAAGMVIGNGLITYTLSRVGYAAAQRRNRRGWAMFFYWTTVASVGNLIDYVPVRTFSSEGDMYSVERGLSWSPWMVLVVLGIPTAIVLADFLLRIGPASVLWIFPDSPSRRNVLLLLSSGALFAFYGAAGLVEGGHAAHLMSSVSACVLFPVASLGSWFLLRRRI